MGGGPSAATTGGVGRQDGGALRPFHPGTARDALLARLMPDYEHEAEVAAFLDPDVTADAPPRRGGRRAAIHALFSLVKS